MAKKKASFGAASYGTIRKPPKLSKEEKEQRKKEKYEKRVKKTNERADKQNKKNRKKLKKIIVDYHTSKDLTMYEKRFYDEIGKPVDGQNYLELFDDVMIHDLKEIMNSTFRGKNDTDTSSNLEKADFIVRELGNIGFHEVGRGTNIVVLRHDKYPGVVYKIALDKCGVTDNFNDEWIYKKHPDMYARYICRHPSGMVSVQEAYAQVRDKGRMQDFIGQAYDMVSRLERNYIIVDLSPVNYKNYGVRRDGRLVIIDGSDIIPIPEGKDLMRCQSIVGSTASGKLRRCGGKLHYTSNYNRVECSVCGKIIVPYELKPRTTYNEKEELTGMIKPIRRKVQRDLNEYVKELIAEANRETSDNSENQNIAISDTDSDEDFYEYTPDQGYEEIDNYKSDYYEDEDDEPVSIRDGCEVTLSSTSHDAELNAIRDQLRKSVQRETSRVECEVSINVGPTLRKVRKEPEEVSVTLNTPTQSANNTSLGEDVDVDLYMNRPAFLDVDYSEDSSELNISILGSIDKAFNEDGPAINISLDGGDNYTRLITPNMLCKFIKIALNERGIKYVE